MCTLCTNVKVHNLDTLYLYSIFNVGVLMNYLFLLANVIGEVYDGSA